MKLEEVRKQVGAREGAGQRGGLGKNPAFA